MARYLRVTLSLLLVLTVLVPLTACRSKEQVVEEEEAFAFVVFPGARYLGQLTDVFKQAHKVIKPNEPEPPPTAIYDTDASVEDVAQYYTKEYGYTGIAPDAGSELSPVKPAAYRRTGDLQADVQGIVPIAQQLNLNLDPAKATGAYAAIEIAAKPNRPRVTIQRPYFDLTTSTVVDRTIILMSR